MAQAILDNTYTDKNGKKSTGYEICEASLIANLADAKGKHWGKAVDLLILLTGANKTLAETRAIEAQTKLIEAKADLLTSADTNTLDKLDTILKEMRDDALKGGEG